MSTIEQQRSSAAFNRFLEEAWRGMRPGDFTRAADLIGRIVEQINLASAEPARRDEHRQTVRASLMELRRQFETHGVDWENYLNHAYPGASREWAVHLLNEGVVQ